MNVNDLLSFTVPCYNGEQDTSIQYPYSAAQEQGLKRWKL